MNIHKKQLKSGFEIDSFAMGTWEMGGKKERLTDYNPEKDIETIQMAYDLGMRRFDTAEIYANGYTEEILGQAISPLPREELFISSKVPKEKLRRQDIRKACEESLKRLDIDYLDMYLIHMPNPSIPLDETMQALGELVDQKLVRNIGVCNFGVESLKRAISVSPVPIVLNQVHYNLMFREPQQAGVLSICEEQDIFVEAWRPLQQGNLCRPGIAQIDALCEKYDKTPAQIAINWLISQKNVVTLAKTSNPLHLRENLGAVDWKMDEEDVQFLKESFIIQLDRSNAVRLG